MSIEFTPWGGGSISPWGGQTTRSRGDGTALDRLLAYHRNTWKKLPPKTAYDPLTRRELQGREPTWEPVVNPVGAYKQFAPQSIQRLPVALGEATGGGLPAPQRYVPPGPPERFTLGMPWSAPEGTYNPTDLLGTATTNLLGGDTGAFIGSAPAAQQGGVMEGPFGLPIATTPVTVGNFATYFREGLLAAGLTAMGRDAPYQQPAGWVAGQPMPIVDSDDPIDGFIRGVNDAGTAFLNLLDAPYKAVSEQRAYEAGGYVRDLYKLGRIQPNLGRMAAHLLDWVPLPGGTWGMTSAIIGGRDTMAAIEKQAAARGISQAAMIADAYDLDPLVVAEISRNPDMSDEELQALVKDQPLSRNPFINTVLYLGYQVGMFVAGGWALKGAGLAARGFTAGTKALGLGGETAQAVAAVAPRAYQWGFRGGRAISAAAGARAGAVAGGVGRVGMYASVGSTAAWRLNNAVTLTGATVRFGEWAYKQVGAFLGDEEMIRVADQWLYTTPLSGNPGLNLIDAFNVAPHPIGMIREARAGVIRVGRGEGSLIVARPGANVIDVGGRLMRVDRDAGRRLRSLAEKVNVDMLHNQFFGKLGWDKVVTEALVKEHKPKGVLNQLLWHALQQVREDLGDRAAAFGMDLRTELERNTAFVNEYLSTAIRKLEGAMAGTETTLFDRFRDYYWNRSFTGDHSDIGALSQLSGPYDPYVAATMFYQHAAVSKLLYDAHVRTLLAEDALTLHLRETISPSQFQYARNLLTDLADTAEVPQRTLNFIKANLRPINAYRNKRLVPTKPNALVKVTAGELRSILREAELENQRAIDTAEAKAALMPTETRPFIEPDDAVVPARVGTALGVSEDAAKVLLDLNEQGWPPEATAVAPPRELLEIVARDTRTTAERLMRTPEYAWTHIQRWFDQHFSDAVQRGEFRATLLDLRTELEARSGLAEGAYGPSRAEPALGAVDRLVLAMEKPARTEYLERHPAERIIWDNAMSATEEVVLATDDWLADPVRDVRTLAVGDELLVVPQGFEAPDLIAAQSVIAKTLRLDTLPVVLREQIDAGLHPVEALYRIRTELEGLTRNDLNAAEKAVLNAADTPLAERLAADIERVLEPTEPVRTMAEVEALQARAQSHAAAFPELVGEIEAAARVMGGEQLGVAQDYAMLVDRARSTPPPPSKRELPPSSPLYQEPWRRTATYAWADQPLATPVEVVPEALRVARSRARIASERLDTLDRTIELVGQERVVVRWEEKPVATFSVNSKGGRAVAEAKATTAAQELQQAGTHAVKVEKRGRYYEVYRGAPERAPESIDDVALAEAAMRQDEPPLPPEAPPAVPPGEEGPPPSTPEPVTPELSPEAQAAAEAYGARPEGVPVSKRQQMSLDWTVPDIERLFTNHPELEPFRAELEQIRAEKLTAGEGLGSAQPGAPRRTTAQWTEARRQIDALDVRANAIFDEALGTEGGRLPEAGLPPEAVTRVEEAGGPPPTWADVREALEGGAGVDEMGDLLGRMEEAGIDIGTARDGYGAWVQAILDGEQRLKKAKSKDMKAALDKTRDSIEEAHNDFLGEIDYMTGPGAAAYAPTEALPIAPEVIFERPEWRRKWDDVRADLDALAQERPELQPALQVLANQMTARSVGELDQLVHRLQRSEMEAIAEWAMTDGAAPDAITAKLRANHDALMGYAPEVLTDRLADTDRAVRMAYDYTFGSRALAEGSRRLESVNRRLVDQLRDDLLASGDRPTILLDWTMRSPKVKRVRWDGDVPHITDDPQMHGNFPEQHTRDIDKPLTRFTAATQDAIDREIAYLKDMNKNAAGWWGRGQAKWMEQVGRDLEAEQAAPPRAAPAAPAAAAPEAPMPAFGDAVVIDGVKFRWREPVAGENNVALAGSNWKQRTLHKLAPDATFAWDEEAGVWRTDAPDPRKVQPREAPAPEPTTGWRTGGYPGGGSESVYQNRTRLIQRLPDHQGRVEWVVSTTAKPQGRTFGSREAAVKHIAKVDPEAFAALPEGRAAAPRAEGITLGADTGFPDPYNETATIPARFQVVNIKQLTSSEMPGFDRSLQPRERAGRVTSDEQVAAMAADMGARPAESAALLLRSESGAEGTPVIGPQGMVVAGNGRTMALRQAPEAFWTAYHDALRQRAAEFGLDPAAITEGSVLVRVVPDELVTPQLAAALNVATGGMAITEQAARIARSLTASDIRALDLGEQVGIADALTAAKNRAFVQRILETLTQAERKSYVDAKGNLNAQGVDLISAAMLSKLMRDPASNRLVARFFESAEEDFRRIRSGLLESLGQLIEAHELPRYPNLAIGDALAQAVDTLDNVMTTTKGRDDIRATLRSPAMFEDVDQAFARHLAATLYDLRSVKEVAAFLRGYARQLESSPDPNQLSIFGDAGEQPARYQLANRALRAVNEAREDAANEARARQAGGMFEAGDVVPDAVALDPFPNALGDVELTEPRIAGPGGDVQPPVLESRPLGATETTPEIEARAPEGVTFEGFEPQERSLIGNLHTGAEGRAGILKRYVEQRERWVESIDGGRTWFEDTVRSANKADIGAAVIPPTDWLLLREMAGGLIRRNAEGKLDMPFVGLSEESFAATVDHLNALDSLAQLPEGPARLIHDPDGTLTAAVKAEAGAPATDSGRLPNAEFEARTGFVADVTAQVETARGTGTDHTLVSGPKDTLVELNQPDKVAMLQTLEARKLAAETELAEAQRIQAEAEVAQPITTATSVSSFFTTPETEASWHKLMNPTIAEDRIALGAVGKWPDTLGDVVDAIRSIDREMYEPLTAAEASALRSDLMLGAHEAITRAGGRAVGDRATQLAAGRRLLDQLRSRTEPGEAPPAIAAEQYADAVAEVLAVMDSVMSYDPEVAKLGGYTGNIYDLSHLPTRHRITKAPLSPRILYREDFIELADHIIPGIADEFEIGAQAMMPKRLADSRMGQFLEFAFGGRPEVSLHAQARDAFETLVQGRLTGLDADLARGLHFDLQAIYAGFQQRIETSHTAFGRFRTKRRVGLLTPGEMVEVADQTLRARYKGELPWWTEQLPLAELPQMWRRADNRLRRYYLERPGGMARFLEGLYMSRGGKGRGEVARVGTWLYGFFRFILDARWVALELTEAPLLALGRGGPGAMRDTMRFARDPDALAGRVHLFGEEAHRLAREQWAWITGQTDPGMNIGSRLAAVLAIMRREGPDTLIPPMLDYARRDPMLTQALRRYGESPEQWLTGLSEDLRIAGSSGRKLSPADAAEVWKPMLDRGIISEKEYAAITKGGYYVALPAVEKWMAETIGQPHVHALAERLYFLNQQAWNDVAQVMFGQADRSNFQRLANHPLLYWPISYQIKAAKWLGRILFSHMLGVDTGSVGVVLLDQAHTRHVQQMQTDPEYAKFFEANKDLFFVAQMIFPITPWDIGVSLSPWTRMVMSAAIGEEEPYTRNFFGVGPGYTYFSLLPRLVAEQSKEGAALEGLPFEELQQFFPATYTVKPSRSQQQQREQELYNVGWEQVPESEPPSDVRLPPWSP